MDLITHLYRRDCGSGDDCEKPTSKLLTDVVPAVVTGVVLIVAGIVFFIIARRRRKQFQREEDKERESLEIDVYEPSHAHYQGPAYGDPFSNSQSLIRDPDYNEFSLAPPTPRRDQSPAKSYNTDSSYEPHSTTSPPPAYPHGGPSARDHHPDNKI
ncbi:hypothetical protein BGW36DRAFT_354579 [Talaromyces proteolyticus]|uniref:Uncharacterized protein n=1 Tax=Talaromyces proteolyticus TaxID=1131652 RepID=A0AAD4Q4E2_9EURO|nr:uncharacterized protein BGW36DRAFT_354579 [Talaromyces proteolyticus]KAH8703146.1 hypothetical protein BGW36DRAFT_354579 [Talaromyces proteolyticus]